MENKNEIRIVDIERFETKFQKLSKIECWNWNAGKSKTGYGVFWLDGKQQSAHRVSYNFYIGTIADNMVVCHSCDNKSCVNPNHLWLGTQSDNVHDMLDKERTNQPKGEKHWNSKLTEEDVSKIREMSKTMKNSAISRILKIARQTVYNIVSNRNWTK